MKQQKLYVVTGAAKAGIGEAVTRRILAEGHEVVGTFASENSAVANSLRAEFNQRIRLCEVQHESRESLETFAASVQTPIEGVVHAQFYLGKENPDQFDHGEWDRSIAVNLSAPNYLTHALKGGLAENASIVVVTSTEGFVGSFGASAYAATKAAIHNLVMSLANTMGKRGVRVNAVAAGWVGGVMETDEAFNMSRRITPLGRLGRPAEIAAVVWFLLSTEASYVNGATIVADGGYSGVDTIAKYEFENSQALSGSVS